MTTTAKVFDTRSCELGEGPLWHPLQKQLYWFDIIGKRLLSRHGDTPLAWQFDEHHSAAGWIDLDTLLIASETGLWRFDTRSGARHLICALEAEDPFTRSNDGRTDPQGGFWIGTMGKQAEPERGAIYRLFKGELRKLFSGLTIPNAICFAPDGRIAFFTDTAIGKIMRQPLDDKGWPLGAPSVFLDLGARGIHPDGAVVDAAGTLWNAQWGRGRVTGYAPDGSEVSTIAVLGRHSSCPAFGGPDLKTLFVTTAREGIDQPDADQGLVYVAELTATGQAEHRLRL